jgi:hypothetical protein
VRLELRIAAVYALAGFAGISIADWTPNIESFACHLFTISSVDVPCEFQSD